MRGASSASLIRRRWSAHRGIGAARVCYRRRDSSTRRSRRVSCRTCVKRALVIAVLSAAPALAMAHGEEIVFLPVGNVAAVLSILVVGLFVAVGWNARLLAIVIAGA